MSPFSIIFTLVSAFVVVLAAVLGGPHTAVAPATVQETASTTTTTQFPTASTTAGQPTEHAGANPPQQKSGLPALAAKTSGGTGDPRTFAGAGSAALSDTDLNTLARSALVNIECTTLGGGAFKPISGSGVVIDSRGVILTNAHVGQFFLLRDYIVRNNITCVVRTGSPAQARYTAELLYLPQSWIDANASQIKADVSIGTGQNDYAFLLITGTTNPNAVLPASFPTLQWDTAPPKVGERMILAAYPAGLLGGDIIATSLYASSAFATVGQLFSYDDGPQVDTFAIGGTVTSQAGSSGGIAASTNGKLRGIISTAVLADTTSASNLFAVSLGHISRSLAAEGQGGIPVLLDGDISAKAAAFNRDVAPQETAALEAVLNAR